MVITRFAPSPTGRLHVGNIRTALHNWLWARQQGGQVLLRLDDTDQARSTPAFAAAIRADLQWLGLNMDGEVRQSDRFALYEAQFDRLVAAGRVYPAFETPEELDLRRKLLAARGRPPIYERGALRLSADERAALIAGGRRPHWRFRLDHDEPIAWVDLVRGPQTIDPATQSDPVVRRADGSWLYLLPSVIDDVAMGITHVVRGEDHVTNTGLQLQMFAALGAPAPAFAHEALLVGQEGKLSKRLGAMGVAEFQADGIEPAALLSLLARLGTSEPVELVEEVAALAPGLDFARFGRAPARFDAGELHALNAQLVHRLPWAAVAERVPAGMTAAMWAAIQPNLATVADAAAWLPVLAGDIAVPPAAAPDRAFLRTAAEAAAMLDWAAEPWAALTGRLKADTGRKGRALFLPLRQALTGLDHGPDMAGLLPLIGPARAVARLQAAAEGESVASPDTA